jgi:hypothetical protein
MTKKRKAQSAETDNTGEVWDLAKVADEQAAAARATLRLLDLPGLPPFVSEALCMILDHAAMRKGVNLLADPKRGYPVKALADLFAVTSGFQHGLSFEPERDLAGHISAVMKHAETPTELFNAIGEVLTDMSNHIDYHTPEMIAKTFKASADAQAKQKGGA